MTRCALSEQGHKALPKEKWVAVMRAAASQFPDLFRLDGQTLCLKMIPDTAASKVAYHNDLMRARRLSLRELIAAMDRRVRTSHSTLPQPHIQPHIRPYSTRTANSLTFDPTLPKIRNLSRKKTTFPASHSTLPHFKHQRNCHFMRENIGFHAIF